MNLYCSRVGGTKKRSAGADSDMQENRERLVSQMDEVRPPQEKTQAAVRASARTGPPRVAAAKRRGHGGQAAR